MLTSFAGPLAAAFRGNDRWRGYSALSAAIAVALFVFMFGLVFLLEIATTLGIYGFFLVMLGWFELIAIRLYRLQPIK